MRAIFYSGEQSLRRRHPDTTDHDMTMRNSAFTFLHENALSVEFSDFEEAARYALLQRLAPALEHHLLGRFQSMGMIASMMERRLQPADPDLAGLREDCASLGSVSRTALNSIMDVMRWIEPHSEHTLKLDVGVRECLGLLSTECRFKGFVILNEVAEIDVELSSRALRSVLSAALIALCDVSRAPAKLVVRTLAVPDSIALSIDLRPTEGVVRNVHVTDYRPLKWRDVEILAIAESVDLARGDTGVQLTFPRTVACAGLPDDLALARDAIT